MTPQEAIIILGRACQAVQADWQGHMAMQEALKVVSGLIPKPEEKKDA